MFLKLTITNKYYYFYTAENIYNTGITNLKTDYLKITESWNQQPPFF